MAATIVSFLLLQAAIASQGEGSFFTLQPENQTVNYGEIVEFRCRVRDYISYGLEMFVGDDAKIFPEHELNALGKNFTQSLHPGEFYADELQVGNCTSCEGIGIFWMVVNSRTLPLMDYFWCRATHNTDQPEESNQAFIVDVLYPECGNRTLVRTNDTPVTTTKIPLLSTKTVSNVHSDTAVTTNNGSQNLIFIWILFIFPLCACSSGCNVF